MDELDVINFTNTDSEDFNGQWGGKIELIKAGETRPFPRFLAEHYAKHLASKILLKEGKDFGDPGSRQSLIAKMLGQVSVPISQVTNLPEEPIKAPELEPEFAEAPKEKVVIPKKRGKTKKIK